MALSLVQTSHFGNGKKEHQPEDKEKEKLILNQKNSQSFKQKRKTTTETRPRYFHYSDFAVRQGNPWNTAVEIALMFEPFYVMSINSSNCFIMYSYVFIEMPSQVTEKPHGELCRDLAQNSRREI